MGLSTWKILNAKPAKKAKSAGARNPVVFAAFVLFFVPFAFLFWRKLRKTLWL